MKALIRGIWILDYNWILESMEHKEWQPEELYEMKSFSKAVAVRAFVCFIHFWASIKLIYFVYIRFQMCRMERQLFGKNYKMNIFSELGYIFLSNERKSRDLKEIIEMSGGVVTKNRKDAAIIIGEYVPESGENKCLLPNWILDSITNAQLQCKESYFIKNWTYFSSRCLF